MLCFSVSFHTFAVAQKTSVLDATVPSAGGPDGPTYGKRMAKPKYFWEEIGHQVASQIT